MFEAEYTDVKLTKVRKFPDVGSSDTLRVFEPTAAFASKGYKDEIARHDAVINQIKKNTFVLVGDNNEATELNSKTNLFDYISQKEGLRLQEAFGAFFLEDDEKEAKSPK